MTTALYRRYRPETFEDVIGQEHVTEPLMTALRKNRVNHAYLFSGPRGCGKTTSARILARCLNCAEGPTATPCGHCDSCRDLSRDGAGSLDVIEMDAASHGGVDHARDLRERATFAPVRDRYKIFIIDEAHMVTREGFNALLKIVEEPPEHVKFIFATTEPSKVLTTIRSRTHHYPFRLVPPEPLMQYLELLSEQEHVATEPGVLSLVVRAGGGSVRDSLSVLDQLMAGSDDRGMTYDLAVALLGYTHAALLDDVVDAFAAGDAATVFSAIDRVVQTGQDPRRFVEDLLERFRDLVVVNAVPDSAANILHGMPTDQINRLRNQANQLGAAELSRAADITNTALNEMTGATSPQLHLELLCARILLPSADHTTRGITARVDRLERRLSIPRGAGIRQGAPETDQHVPTDDAAPAPQHQTAPERAPQPAAPPTEAPPSAGMNAPTVEEPTDPQDGTEEPEGTSHPAAAEPVPERERETGSDTPPADGRTGPGEPDAAHDNGPVDHGPEHRDTTPARPDSEEPGQSRGAAPSGAPSGTGGAQGHTAPAQSAETHASADQGGEIELLRASWPEIVSALAEIRRVAWTVTMRGTPVTFDGQTLRIAFDAEGDLLNFPRFENDVRAAIHSVLGIDCRIEAVRPGDTHGGGQSGGGSGGPTRGGNPGGNGPGGPGRGGRQPSNGQGRPDQAGGGQGRGGQDRRTHQGPQDHQEPGEQQSTTEPPAYFREQEGFGAQRRRPAAEPQQTAGEQPTEQSNDLGRDQGEQEQASRRTPQDRESTPQPEPEPSPEEPVTSWSVAKIPQGRPAESTSDADSSDQADEAQTGEAKAAPVVEDSSVESSDPTPISPADLTIGTGEDVGSDNADLTNPETSSVDTSGDTREDMAAESQPVDSLGQEQGRAPNTENTSDASPSGSGIRQTTQESDSDPDGQESAQTSASASASASVQNRPSASGGRQFAQAPEHPSEPNNEYWTPNEPPPPPEEEPPADLYETSDRRPSGSREQAPAQVSSPRNQRPSFRERHAAEIAAARQRPSAPQTEDSSDTNDDENFSPSADDESIEDSSLYGRAAIERSLGGLLIEERPHQAN